MSKEYLTEQEAKDLVEQYVQTECPPITTQEILNSGEIPMLKSFVVRHGKVSDCIFGGKGDFVIPAEEEENYRNQLNGLSVNYDFFVDTADKDKPKFRISFENPSLKTKDGADFISMTRTGRISSHDKERGNIPFKDQILAINHEMMRRLVLPFLGSSQFDLGLPSNSVFITAEKVTGMDYENVIRAHMAKSGTSTSLYQSYVVRGERVFSGYSLPDDLFPNGPCPFIMDTPSTKSDLHDETVAPEDLFDMRICNHQEYYGLRNNSIASFGAVQGFLMSRGIIIADTKTEHGYDKNGKIKSKDELYTMDSSRYWLFADYMHQLELYLTGRFNALINYLKKTQAGITEKDYMVNGSVVMVPKSYSKEFARGFSVADNKYTPEQREAIAVRYIMGLQHLTLERFEPDMRPWHERVIEGFKRSIEQLF